eukprot:147386_1
METWNCSECTFSNHACLLSCELCETPKHKSNSIQKENSNRLLLENDDENNDNNSDKPDAICNQCIYANHDTANKHQCNLCESLRPNYFDNNNTNTKYDDFECALHVIIACAQNDESVINILETLKVITSRITDKNPKYRVLDTSTQSVQCRLLGFEGSLEYLELLGYSLDVSTGKLKCFKHPPQHILDKVIILIISHLHNLKALVTPTDCMLMGRSGLERYISENNPSCSLKKFVWTKQRVIDLPKQLRWFFIDDEIKRCMNILNAPYDVLKFKKYIYAETEELSTIDEIMLIIKTSSLLPRNRLCVAGFIRNIKNIQHTIPAELICICFDYFYVEPLDTLLFRENHTVINRSEKLEIRKNIVWQICTKHPQRTDLLQKILISADWIMAPIRMPEFRNDIVAYIDTCAKFDHESPLKLFTKHYHYEQEDITITLSNDEMVGFINTAATYGSDKCISFLLQKVRAIDWTKHRKLICLYNAVKYNHDNLEFIDL